LERLLYRPKDIACIRILIITPTRELANQIYGVLEKLAQFTDITYVLICGGKKDVRSQEISLKQRPDIVVRCSKSQICVYVIFWVKLLYYFNSLSKYIYIYIIHSICLFTNPCIYLLFIIDPSISLLLHPIPLFIHPSPSINLIHYPSINPSIYQSINLSVFSISVLIDMYSWSNVGSST
jgi:hypothetical protein